MPADATIVTLRKDVATALETKGPWSQSFERVHQLYVPKVELEEVDHLRVTVAKAGWLIEQDNRAEWANDYQIDVAIQYRTKAAYGSTEATGKYDEMMLLQQEFAEYFQDNRPTYADCPLMEIEFPNGPYVPDHIERLNQFTGVIRLTFQKWR
jgi:hypothetical protein